jgi:uncharacterized protein YaiI (UPF0178 family)
MQEKMGTRGARAMRRTCGVQPRHYRVMPALCENMLDPGGTNSRHYRIDSSRMSEPISLYIDADACPVKDEVYRVAERHLLKGVALKVFVVANSFINTPRVDFIERMIVPGGMNVADDWIAERARRGDIVITADVPLAARAVKAGADAIAPNGKPFTQASIGNTLATRNLMTDLRSAGAVTGGPAPFSARDRSQFLSALDLAIVRLTRAGFGKS